MTPDPATPDSNDGARPAASNHRAARAAVLVVEDDTSIRRGVVDALRHAGFDVLESANGRDAVAMALESTVDLVLLDVMLPHANGFEVLEAVRRSKPALPVIMVTARGTETDRVRGLTTGADDYVVKPFSIRELVARIDAVLRRSPERQDDVRTLRAGDCTIDLARREITRPDADPVPITERDAGILRYLAGSRGRAVDRRELLQHVWGLNPRGLRTRTVDMHIARLREKVETDPAAPRIIRTVRGKGYILADDVTVDGP